MSEYLNAVEEQSKTALNLVHLLRDAREAIVAINCENALLEVEIKRLRAALTEIAGQHLSTEMSDEDAENASWIEGFDMCVETARAAMHEVKKQSYDAHARSFAPSNREAPHAD